MDRFKNSLLCSLLFAVITLGVSYAADISEESIKLEHHGIMLNLERYEDLEFNGSKEPLLMVHGLTYSSHQFDINYADYSLARFFANQGFEVWLLDLAGYGRSGAVKDGFIVNSDYGADDIAAAVRFILKKRKLAKLSLLGWSWGTVTTGRFTANYPELVRRLVLYAPIVNGLGYSKVTEPFHHNTYEHALEDFQRTPNGSIDFELLDENVLNTYAANCWKYDGKGSPNGARADLLVSSRKQLIPLERITVPVLIIAGNKDQYVSLQQCEDAYLRLPNRASEIYIHSGAAHAMFLERNAYRLFRERVLQFLQK